MTHPKPSNPRTQPLRSACPINYSLETIGDGWSLLIVRDIVYFGKKTYGEFIAAGEGIARNILANRLARLEQNGILTKTPHPKDGRKDIYGLTERGLDLISLLLDMADWGAHCYKEADAPAWWLAAVCDNRATIIKLIRETVKGGGSIFVGGGSVVAQIGGSAAGVG